MTMPRLLATLLWCTLALPMGSRLATADEGTSFDTIRIQFDHDIRPIVSRYCLNCHSTQDKEGELDLERFQTLSAVRRDSRVWQQVLGMLTRGEMPPEGNEQPSPYEAKQLRVWVQRYLDAEAEARAGDPGPVVLRRLNNAEYTYTIRDLTGVELDPTSEFPADGAAGEGFTNTGNALVMSPALLRKYLDAAKEIASHAVLLPDGFRFSPHATRRDWTDEILARIRGVYGKFVDSSDLGVGEAVGNLNVHGNTRLGRAGRLPIERYFTATIGERHALSTGTKTIERVAAEHGLNARYLGTLWSALSATSPSRPSQLLDSLRARWQTADRDDAAQLAADVAVWQKALWKFSPVGLIGRTGSAPQWLEPVTPLVEQQEMRLAMPKAPKGAPSTEVLLSLVVTDAGDGHTQDFVVFQQPRFVAEGRADVLLQDLRIAIRDASPVEDQGAEPRARSTDGSEWGLNPALFGRHPNGGKISAASLCVQAPALIQFKLPAQWAAGYEFVTTAALPKGTGEETSVQTDVVVGEPEHRSGLLPIQVAVNFSAVTQVFSERRVVSYVRPILVRQNGATHQRLEAAFDDHRNLFPAALCYAQIVPVDETLTVTLFYREDDQLARLMLSDSQKARLDRLWDELRYVSHSPLLHLDSLELLLETMSVSPAHQDRSHYEALLPLREPYTERAAAFRHELVETEPKQIDALVDFAARAYRRPLSDQESRALRSLYQDLRNQTMPHETAFRLTLARVLTAPEFLYRFEERRSRDHVAGNRPRASSETDAAVVHAVSEHEFASRLSYFLWSSTPDDALRSAADAGKLHTTEEILAQTRRMLKSARVRRLAVEFACQWLHIRDFAELDEKSAAHFPGFAALRQNMLEESIRFFTDLFQNDGSILSILNAEHTFLNEPLAAHYGVPDVKGEEWQRVSGVRQFARGGILTQAAVLAKQSGASRTNPVIRGTFVFETLLGERMPRPPENVPELPEAIPEGLTERALFEQHSSVPACAKCHVRIDPYGFALENFDAVGRWREKDSSGHAIDARTTLEDSTKIDGVEGLREYLLTDRREDFVRQFCRKLLGYSLGRAVQLSDEPILEAMTKRLANEGYRANIAVEMIVSSDPFRKIRGRE